MSRVRSKDTGPELTVRRLLHSLGFRFRLHRRDLPGTPDIVLPRHHVAVLVHGCFWHGHDCSLFRMPATRTEFWKAKIDANRHRDAEVRSDLLSEGWRTLCVWECAIRGSARLSSDDLAMQIITFLSERQNEGDIAGHWDTKSRERIDA
ncbi:very short patch repair endonuclease [Tsuneonella suprasediminis]|uniref:very short patch repair endonuclease n=1 Tax=Tsuneonella suprasediminis TaxID=2306996 RepID=UPI002F956C90